MTKFKRDKEQNSESESEKCSGNSKQIKKATRLREEAGKERQGSIRRTLILI